MAGTTSNTHGRVRLVDTSQLYSRWLDTLATRSSPRPPDAIPVLLADPDRGFIDFIRYNTWKNVLVATGAGTAAQVIWAGPGGKLLTITVQTTNTAPITIYDNASAASGNVLFTVPANAPTNTFYSIQCGVMNGITAGRVLNSPALLVSYCEV